MQKQKYLVTFQLNRDKWAEIVDNAESKTDARKIALGWLINRIENDPKSLLKSDDIIEIKTYGQKDNKQLELFDESKSLN